jgi:uncharacterized membrane protein (UPF0136 family)
MNCTLNELRAAYERETNRSLSMPVAGAVVWFVIGLCGYFLPEDRASLVMLFGTGLIFPIALLIAKLRHENMTDRLNPLSRLMGMSVLMVNLLWAVHLPLLIGAPMFLPLSLGIGLGIHWIVYSWIIQHPVGLIHAIVRTALIVSVWSILSAHRMFAVPMVIVIVYIGALVWMAKRPIPSLIAEAHLATR